VAYVTKSKGVALHKTSCSFIQKADISRLLEAKFEASAIEENTSRYHVSLLLELDEHVSRLKDIVALLDQNKVTILSFSTEKHEGDRLFRKMVIDIIDDPQLDKIIAELIKISGVLNVTRA
jgi:(p)ppGpp synthase/HD superfamily hydrolase